jgi:hypothetical protein
VPLRIVTLLFPTEDLAAAPPAAVLDECRAALAGAAAA